MLHISNRLLYTATVCILVLTAQPLLADALSLQAVLDRHRQAIGGDAAIMNVRSVFIQGRTLATEDTVEMPFKAWYQPAQHRMRLEYLFLGVPGVVSYDGERGWNVPPVISNRQAMPMQGADLLQIREQADFFGPLIHPRDDNVTLTLLPPQQTAEGVLQRIEVQRRYTLPRSAPPQADAAEPATDSAVVVSIWKLDGSTWLTREVESQLQLADGSKLKLTVSYGDYRVVTGPDQTTIVWPHRVTTDDGSGAQQINVLDQISINVPLDDVRFDLSPDQR